MVDILEVKTRNGLTSLSVHESQGKAGTSLEHLREDCPEDDEIVFSSIREAAGYFVPPAQVVSVGHAFEVPEAMRSARRSRARNRPVRGAA